MNPYDLHGFVDRAYLVFLFAIPLRLSNELQLKSCSHPPGLFSMRTIDLGYEPGAALCPLLPVDAGRRSGRVSLPMEVQTATRLARIGLCPQKGHPPLLSRSLRTEPRIRRLCRAGHMPVPPPRASVSASGCGGGVWEDERRAARRRRAGGCHPCAVTLRARDSRAKR